jgi:hypothetical protein
MHTTTAAITDQRRRISSVLENRCELSDVLDLSASYTNSHKLRRVYTGLTRAFIAFRIGRQTPLRKFGRFDQGDPFSGAVYELTA